MLSVFDRNINVLGRARAGSLNRSENRRARLRLSLAESWHPILHIMMRLTLNKAPSFVTAFSAGRSLFPQSTEHKRAFPVAMAYIINTCCFNAAANRFLRCPLQYAVTTFRLLLKRPELQNSEARHEDKQQWTPKVTAALEQTAIMLQQIDESGPEKSTMQCACSASRGLQSLTESARH